MTTGKFLKDALGWGFVLWMIGYVLGIVLFFMLPHAIIGWVIMPIATVITLLILLTRKVTSLGYYAGLSLIWTAIAIAFDYFFIVKTFKPEDGYYKPDVYIYYALTLLLPLIVGLFKHSGSHEKMVHTS